MDRNVGKKWEKTIRKTWEKTWEKNGENIKWEKDIESVKNVQTDTRP